MEKEEHDKKTGLCLSGPWDGGPVVIVWIRVRHL